MRNPLLITKKELAQKLKITSTTLRRWLNVIEIDELTKRRYRPTQKFLTKEQLDYLFPTGIELTENERKQTKTP